MKIIDATWSALTTPIGPHSPKTVAYIFVDDSHTIWIQTMHPGIILNEHTETARNLVIRWKLTHRGWDLFLKHDDLNKTFSFASVGYRFVAMFPDEPMIHKAATLAVEHLRKHPELEATA